MDVVCSAEFERQQVIQFHYALFRTLPGRESVLSADFTFHLLSRVAEALGAEIGRAYLGSPACADDSRRKGWIGKLTKRRERSNDKRDCEDYTPARQINLHRTKAHPP